MLSAGPGVTAEHRLYAALLTQAPEGSWPPGLAISHTTAAAYYGFECLPSDPVIHQVVPRTWIPRYRRPGLLMHHCHTPAEHIVLRNGIPLTDPAWTVLTLARCLPRDCAIVIADAALRSGECTLDELHAALPKIARLRGCVQARQVVELARTGTDSCQETMTRIVLVDGGLPKPDVDIRLYDDYGRLLARGDLGYRRLLIWMEYDGFDVHTRRSVFRRDRARQNWLQDRGWYVLRYTDESLTSRRRMIHEVSRALVAAPARITALAPGLSPEGDDARRSLRG